MIGCINTLTAAWHNRHGRITGATCKTVAVARNLLRMNKFAFKLMWKTNLMHWLVDWKNFDQLIDRLKTLVIDQNLQPMLMRTGHAGGAHRSKNSYKILKQYLA